MPDEPYWGTFFNPSCVATKLGIAGRCGDVVEFGCGYGTFTIPVARQVAGQVLALDIEPDMIAITSRRAKDFGLLNVKAEVRDFIADGSGLPDGGAGYALLFNILHIEDPVALLAEARRALAPGGRVGIIHWRNDIETPRGPSAAIRPTAEQCRAWGERAGLTFVRYEPLACCPWHWGLLMHRDQ